jgi:hypothetical protein
MKVMQIRNTGSNQVPVRCLVNFYLFRDESVHHGLKAAHRLAMNLLDPKINEFDSNVLMMS